MGQICQHAGLRPANSGREGQWVALAGSGHRPGHGTQAGRHPGASGQVGGQAHSTAEELPSAPVWAGGSAGDSATPGTTPTRSAQLCPTARAADGLENGWAAGSWGRAHKTSLKLTPKLICIDLFLKNSLPTPDLTKSKGFNRFILHKLTRA